MTSCYIKCLRDKSKDISKLSIECNFIFFYFCAPHNLMESLTVVVMVARGRRTHGLFTTASDTAGSHWHLDNFSGKRCYKGRKRKRKVIDRTPYLCDSLVAISSEGICQIGEKSAYQGLNGRCHPTSHKVIESLITVNAKDCFRYNAILTKAKTV